MQDQQQDFLQQDNIVETQLPGKSTMQSENKKSHLGIVVGMLALAALFGSLGYYLGTQSSEKQQMIVDMQVLPSATPMTEPTAIPQDDEYVSNLPMGWTYKSSEKCNVDFAIPPKQEPYYYPSDPNVRSGVTGEQGSGRFWDFPRGSSYPHLLSKLPSWDDTNFDIQAMAAFASPEEASGYVSQAVAVSCIPNNGQFATNAELITSLELQLNEYNTSTEEKGGMQPATYTIKANQPTQRWGQDVVDLVVAAGDSGENSSESTYTMFVTPKNIYEIRVFGATEDDFVIQTGKQIFENLRFRK